MFIGRIDVEAETLVLWPPDARPDSLEKTLMLGEIESRRRRRQENEMVGLHHGLNGPKFEQVPGARDGQGSLACYSPWHHRVGHD